MYSDNDWFLYLTIGAMTVFMLILLGASLTDRDAGSSAKTD